jgi:16S rRNA (guanine(966)-N(2))-methyltransferase RsmD
MIRLTGGELRGRGIETPSHLRTRPTQAKLRQALFNSLQTVISDARVLELFAGSGALGFEALSRGAASVVFVENSRAVAKLIEKNARSLGVSERVTVICETAESSFESLERFAPFDIVLADPPYEEYVADKALKARALLSDPRWEKLLIEDGRFCLETVVTRELPDGLPDTFGFLAKIREKTYGDSLLTTYRRTGEVS